jgi:hypothetical protein
MTPLERISERVRRLGDPEDPASPRPLLSVEEFFEGNECTGSIGCNLPGAPTPKQFRELFEAFAKRPDVKDIRVRITAFDDPDWPFTDTVYVITTSAPESVHAWFPEDLAPDEVSEGFYENEAREPYEVPPGCRVVACWWD